LEGLAAKLAARHATDEEISVLRRMVQDDRALLGGDPRLLSRANKRFHRLIHLASHNRFLVQQLIIPEAAFLISTVVLKPRNRLEFQQLELQVQLFYQIVHLEQLITIIHYMVRILILEVL
jgi:DNA-binding GntR family transcriptional regulator